MQETGPSAAARPLRAVGSPGEAVEPAPLEFNRYYYEHDCGIPYTRSPEWLQYFDELADHVVRTLQPTRVLDAGCALGMLVEKLRERGVEAWGIDISEFAIGQVHESMSAFCAVGSLVDPLPPGFPEHFDLVTCIEVVEHMRPTDADAAVQRMASAGDRILFSSSPVDFGEVTHVNVQAPEHWSGVFARAGRFRNVDFAGGFPTPWTALYEPGSAEVGEVVRRYDRRLVRLVDELRDVRETALRLQEQVANLEATDGGAAIVQRDEAIRRAEELDAELAEKRGILESRGGRWLGALHAARRVLRRPE